jgi:hypothetical protein
MPFDVIADVGRDPFQVSKYNPIRSLFKLFGIAEEDVKKILFYRLLSGDVREWYHSLLHTDRDNWDILKNVFLC